MENDDRINRVDRSGGRCRCAQEREKEREGEKERKGNGESGNR